MESNHMQSVLAASLNLRNDHVGGAVIEARK